MNEEFKGEGGMRAPLQIPVTAHHVGVWRWYASGPGYYPGPVGYVVVVHPDATVPTGRFAPGYEYWSNTPMELGGSGPAEMKLYFLFEAKKDSATSQYPGSLLALLHEIEKIEVPDPPTPQQPSWQPVEAPVDAGQVIYTLASVEPVPAGGTPPYEAVSLALDLSGQHVLPTWYSDRERASILDGLPITPGTILSFRQVTPGEPGWPSSRWYWTGFDPHQSSAAGG